MKLKGAKVAAGDAAPSRSAGSPRATVRPNNEMQLTRSAPSRSRGPRSLSPVVDGRADSGALTVV
jgi:hypothetical protein